MATEIRITLTKEGLLQTIEKAWFAGNKAPRDQYNGEIAFLQYRKAAENAIDKLLANPTKKAI